MSYNPYIERIQVEQIQEFDGLDLVNLDPADTDIRTILFDPQTKKFYLVTYTSTGGTVILNKAVLTQDFTVNTDDLSLPRGFQFKSGWDLDSVVNALCNPPVQGVLTLTASPVLIEVNILTNVMLTYTWVKNGEGDPATVIEYFRGATPIATIPDALTSGNVGTITYKVQFTTTPTVNFPATLKVATTPVNVVYPFFAGAGSGNTIGDAVLDATSKQQLWDISGHNYLIANFDTIGSGAPQYFWFATHQTQVPTEWVEIDSSGNENPLNRGPINTAFNAIGNKTHNGKAYTIWMGVQPTDYINRIKIKF